MFKKYKKYIKFVLVFKKLAFCWVWGSKCNMLIAESDPC